MNMVVFYSTSFPYLILKNLKELQPETETSSNFPAVILFFIQDGVLTWIPMRINVI